LWAIFAILTARARDSLDGAPHVARPMASHPAGNGAVSLGGTLRFDRLAANLASATGASQSPRF
jgi:hypothetical protein